MDFDKRVWLCNHNEAKDFQPLIVFPRPSPLWPICCPYSFAFFWKSYGWNHKYVCSLLRLNYLCECNTLLYIIALLFMTESCSNVCTFCSWCTYQLICGFWWLCVLVFCYDSFDLADSSEGSLWESLAYSHISAVFQPSCVLCPLSRMPGAVPGVSCTSLSSSSFIITPRHFQARRRLLVTTAVVLLLSFPHHSTVSKRPGFRLLGAVPPLCPGWAVAWHAENLLHVWMNNNSFVRNFIVYK